MLVKNFVKFLQLLNIAFYSLYVIKQKKKILCLTTIKKVKQ